MKVRKRAADGVQRVYARLQAMAATFELRPSEHVNEVELAARLGVSRTPVREALNRLATEGMVTFVPNKGFFCRPLEANEIANLSELRAGVEGVAVLAACEKASDADIAALARSWRGVIQRLKSMNARDLAVEDEQFHESLVSLAGNSELDKVIRNINVRIRFVRECAIEHPKRRKDTVSEHAEVIEALQRRDGAKARTVLERHVRITGEDALDYITQGLARIYLRRPGEERSTAG